MRIDPRANEWKPIVGLLEALDNGEFADPGAFAKAVIKQAYETFLEREWWALVWRNDGHNQLWGLYATEGQAIKALETNELGLHGMCAVFRIASATARAGYVKEH